MATKILRIEVCDICGSEKNLTKFRITEVRGQSKGITLCDDKTHGAPVLRRLLSEADGKATATPRGRAHVATMDEVKAARKKASPPPRGARTRKKGS